MLLKLASDQIRHCYQSLHPAQMLAIDEFDRIPDSLLLLVFSKLGDIKALGRCCAVSKRFNSLIPLVDDVTVKVDCVISGEGNADVRGKGYLGFLVRFFLGSLMTPLQVLQRYLGPKKTVLTEVSHHSPGEVLKNFREIRNLRIELPRGELGIEDGVLLKWKAEFGSTLESCVILGASSMVDSGDKQKSGKCESAKFCTNRTEERFVLEAGRDGEFVSGSQEDNSSIPESFYTNGGLKLRVVWTISSLIAASARHYLLHQIICDHPSLENLVLTDTDGQGMLCMSKGHLQDFRDKPVDASALSTNRTQVPALNVKLWYAPYLELPGGRGMRGATLVAIRPSDQPIRKDAQISVSGAFEEPFKTAASKLVRRQTYLLEMNSF